MLIATFLLLLFIVSSELWLLYERSVVLVYEIQSIQLVDVYIY
ncbi:protein of unknown function [Shewanella benthica]|uniref:Uncharacterized protein n=1 Tax=Shewanella benthica TaxID=43661 RepID=A0A330MAB3_9GAMM|nr:protein of unknown function [Shewanella benthica]